MTENLSMSATVASRLDSLLLRYCGVPYALATRDRMIHERARYLVQKVNTQPRRARILDAGCGSGLALLYLDRYCRGRVASYTGVDIETDKIAKRYRYIGLEHSFLNLDLCSTWSLWPFDLIFCSEVIEHIIEDQSLLCRLAAHLRPKGTLLLTTPHKPFVEHWAQWLEGFDAVSSVQDGGHVRIGYDRHGLESLAGRAGLRIVEHSFLSPISLSELRYRERLKGKGQHVNTTAYNWTWMAKSLTKTDIVCSAVSHWTIAVTLTRRDAPLSYEYEGET